MAEKSVITNLEKRIEQLIDDHKRLSGICSDLTRQCDKLKVENRQLAEEVKALNAQLAKEQLIEGLSGGGLNRDKARMRVNYLMREVDKCIALLSGRLNAMSEKEGNR